MHAQVKVNPSLLSADFSKLAEELETIERGGADMVHFDVMDGHFVPNITVGPPVLKSLKPHTRLPFDVHLMIERPDDYLEQFHDAGANLITVQQEACIHLQRTLAHIRKIGAKAGLALNPATSLDCLEYVIGDLDLLLVMTVNPGFGGQKFLDSVVPKIRKAREMIDRSGHDIMLEVDGGIDARTAPVAVAAGARVLVAGTAVFTHPPYRDAIATLRGAAELAAGPAGPAKSGLS